MQYTSNGDLRRKQSNHKTDESVKIGQSVEFFGLLLFFIGDTHLSKKTTLYRKKKIFDQKFF